MLLHAIGRFGPPGITNPWIEKYIFPGVYAPALSEVLAAIEGVGLFVTDIEILRFHYAETLRAWRQRFRQHWEEAARIYDERFCRMWDFYLVSCEAAFRTGEMMVFSATDREGPDLDATHSRLHVRGGNRALSAGLPLEGAQSLASTKREGGAFVSLEVPGATNQAIGR